MKGLPSSLWTHHASTLHLAYPQKEEPVKPEPESGEWSYRLYEDGMNPCGLLSRPEDIHGDWVRYETWQETRDALKAALARSKEMNLAAMEFVRMTPASLNCQDLHHDPYERHGDSMAPCPKLEKWEESREKLLAILQRKEARHD